MLLKCFILLAFVCFTSATPLDFKEQFEDYVKTYNKVYKDEAERQMRFKIFVENLINVNELAKAHPEAKFGLNKFSDWTKEEKARVNGIKGKPQAPAPLKENAHYRRKQYNLPSSFDWRSRNMVTPVKDQGGCGSCWTFQAIAVLESHLLLTGQAQQILSEQELVDCARLWGSHGCEGGTSNSALQYVEVNKVATENQYPYVGIDETCRANYNQSGRVGLKEWTLLPYDTNNAAYQLMQLGPIGWNIWVPDSLFSYQSGVYNPSAAECLRAEEEAAGHAITIVGFGTENNVPYWIIKNSWGSGWGDQGYFKMAQDSPCEIDYANPNVPGKNVGYFLAITK